VPIPVPPGFRGDFLSGPEGLDPWARSSGPWEVPPLAVARPRDATDVTRLLRMAADAGHPIIPRGAGTGMPGGNLGRGIVLDLTHPDLCFIDRVDPDRRTIRVGPGAVVSRVDEMAAAAGLCLPPLPSSASRCTLGGMVGTNAAGARSFRHGAIRNWVVGLDIVLVDGSVHALGPDDPGLPPLERLSLPDNFAGPDPPGLREWPRVRKNSSGYGLDRFLLEEDPIHLIVGSEGTLGVVTGVTLRLAARAPERSVLLLALPHMDLLSEGVRMAGEHGASACEFLGRRLLELVSAAGHAIPGTAVLPEAVLLLEIEGDREEVEAATAAVRGEAGGLGIPLVEARPPDERKRLWGIRHEASPLIQAMAERGLRSLQIIEDSVVPPPQLPAYLAGVRDILSSRDIDHVIFGHAGDGNAHVNPLVDPSRPGAIPALREVLRDTTHLVKSLGGTLTGEHGDGRLRAPLLSGIWPSHLFEAFRAVKDAFDPDGILNPGVILPLEGQDPLAGLAGTVNAAPD
jgi:FAD/FMN-containing dehydrogenase